MVPLEEMPCSSPTGRGTNQHSPPVEWQDQGMVDSNTQSMVDSGMNRRIRPRCAQTWLNDRRPLHKSSMSRLPQTHSTHEGVSGNLTNQLTLPWLIRYTPFLSKKRR